MIVNENFGAKLLISDGGSRHSYKVAVFMKPAAGVYMKAPTGVFSIFIGHSSCFQDSTNSSRQNTKRVGSFSCTPAGAFVNTPT